MLTALLHWMSKSRREQRVQSSHNSRHRGWQGDGFGRILELLLPPSLRRLWKASTASRTLNLEAFEDRLLFNAAPAPMPAPVANEVVVVASAESATDANSQSASPSGPSPADGVTTSTAQGILSPKQDVTALNPAQSEGAVLIVVDTTIPDAQSLLEKLTQLRTAGADVLVLDSQRDGLEQIAERLAQLGQTRAIHILSHGDEVGLHLGSNWLSRDTLTQRTQSLAQWQPLLTADADILFYGCDLAANAVGQGFLQAFGEMTGADVAASTNATGAADLGGDWKLEYQFGSIETSSLGEQVRLFDWEGLLTTNTYQQGVGGYTSTVDTSYNPAAPGTSYGTSTTLTVGGPNSSTGLIRFDNLFGNGVGQIPLGSTITSASLRLNVTAGTAVDSTIALHRVLTNWSGTSTYTSLGSGLSRDGVEVSTVADALVNGTTATGTRTISADGKTMTIRGPVKLPNGKKATMLSVYDKQ